MKAKGIRLNDKTIAIFFVNNDGTKFPFEDYQGGVSEVWIANKLNQSLR